jgi:hydrogenase maturation protease
MPRVAVIGFGNPLRRDDGAGWRVVEAIADRWRGRVTFLMGQQPLPEWAAPLSETDLAFIVDAAIECGERPRLARLEPISLLLEPSLGGHGFAPGHLLALTELVYGRAPETYLLLLPIHDVDFGETLSPRTKRAAEIAIRYFNRLLRRTLSNESDVHVLSGPVRELGSEPRVGDVYQLARPLADTPTVQESGAIFGDDVLYVGARRGDAGALE